MMRDEVEELLHADEADGPVEPDEDFDHYGRRMSWAGIEDALNGEDPFEDLAGTEPQLDV